MDFLNGFPYTNFHNLNMDWIIKIAKDFLDQYTHIQELIEQGKTDIQGLTSTSLEELEQKKTELEGLLNAWYLTHSEDIANQLATSIAELNRILSANISAFNGQADQKTASCLESIPDDYSTMANEVQEMHEIIFTVSPVDVPVINGAYYSPDIPTAEIQYNVGMNTLFADIETASKVWITNTVLATYDAEYLFYNSNRERLTAPMASTNHTNNDLEVNVPANAKYIAVNSRADGVSPALKSNGVAIFQSWINNADAIVAVLNYLYTFQPISNVITGAYYAWDNPSMQIVYNAMFKTSLTDIHQYTKIYYTNTVRGTYDVEFIWYAQNGDRISYGSIPEATHNNINTELEVPNNAYYIAINSPIDGIDPVISVKQISELLTTQKNDFYVIDDIPQMKYVNVNGQTYTLVVNSAYRTYILDCQEGDIFAVTGYLPGVTSMHVAIFLDSANNVIGYTPTVTIDTVFNDYKVVIPVNCTKVLIQTYYGTQGSGQRIGVKKRSNSQTVIPMEIVNMKYGALGDSITAGANAQTTYPDIVGSIAKVLIENYGRSGTKIASSSTDTDYPPMVTRYVSMADDLDIITVMGGTNDCSGEVPMGTDDSTDITTFKGALNVLCSGLNTKYVGKRLGFITPIQRTDIYNESQENYVNAIKTICAKYSIPVLDLYHAGNIPYGASSLLGDGVHPTDEGLRVIARKVAHFINTL